MKRRAIYLDANNDIYTTLGKLERLDAEEVILVIPKSSVLVHSLVNFKILKSEAQRRHKTLAIVTVDAKGQQLAQRVGIPVFNNLELNDEEAVEPPPALIPPPPPLTSAPLPKTEVKIKYKRRVPLSRAINQTPAKINREMPAPVRITSTLPARPWQIKKDWGRNSVLLGWIAGAVAVLGIVLYLVVPRATVALEVRSEPFVHNFKLVLADKTDKEAAGQNVFKGRFVTVEKKMTQNFPSTGVKNNGNQASGNLTIYNYTRSAKPLGFRAQTRFMTSDGQIFKSQSEILVPSATVGAGSKLMPGRAKVMVVAETGGAKGNLPVGAKLTIPGLGNMGVDMVYGQIDEPLAGGTDAEVKMVSEDDIKSARESISKNVFVDAEAELQAQAGKREELIPDLIQNDVINITPSAPVGTAQDNFDLDIQIRSWTLLPERGQLSDIMQNTVVIIVPANRELTPQTLKTMRLSLDNADFATHIIDFTVNVDGLVAPKISPADISESLANRKLSSVDTLFNSIPDVISHTVTLWPFWVKKMPLLESNIKIVFSYVSQ